MMAALGRNDGCAPGSGFTCGARLVKMPNQRGGRGRSDDLGPSATVYNVLRGLHIIAVIAWMAGMLYLPRLYVYHTRATAGSEMDETFKTMELKLLRMIINPAMFAVLIFGGSLFWVDLQRIGPHFWTQAVDADQARRALCCCSAGTAFLLQRAAGLRGEPEHPLRALLAHE